ncbi:MAG: hypothetical protein JST54_26775 [Deltaproteobacteria bacterium]|nr:hypothetical protein [Deltaproteobacteria bacterium]
MALRLLLSTLLLAGCSVSFDPAGQPCDAQGRCLVGYTCDATKHCVAGDGGHPSTTTGSGSTSAGSVTGSSGTSGSTTGTTATHGTGSTSGTTATTATTSGTTGGSSGTTGATSCAEQVCPATQRCVMTNGVPSCTSRTDPGATCTSGLACGNGFCLRPPGVNEGICANSCDAGCGAGFVCTPLVGERGNTFSACLDSPAPTTCSGGASCGNGLSCLPFDVSPATHTGFATELPLLFCDTPIPAGTPSNFACSQPSECASGLCADNGSNTNGTCLDTCVSDNDCINGDSCRVAAQIDHSRNLLACVPGITACQTGCTSCGADAYTCEATLNFCALPCLTGDDEECGPGRSCLQNSFGNYCSVSGNNPCP